jgi:hypothetical protein
LNLIAALPGRRPPDPVPANHVRHYHSYTAWPQYGIDPAGKTGRWRLWHPGS